VLILKSLILTKLFFKVRHIRSVVYTIYKNEDEGDDKDDGNGERYRRAKGGGNYS